MMKIGGKFFEYSSLLPVCRSIALPDPCPGRVYYYFEASTFFPPSTLYLLPFAYLIVMTWSIIEIDRFSLTDFATIIYSTQHPVIVKTCRQHSIVGDLFLFFFLLLFFVCYVHTYDLATERRTLNSHAHHPHPILTPTTSFIIPIPCILSPHTHTRTVQ